MERLSGRKSASGSKLNDALKNIATRIKFWICVMIAALICDEWLKEGYLFDFSDVVNLNFTHEKIIVSFIILLIGIFAVEKKRKKQD